MAERPWKSIRLGDLLTQVSRPTQIDPASEYPLLGAHWYAKGLYTKEVKQGAAIKASNIYRVEYGDFVYNRLFAWKGSFAVATIENDGCFVSNEFPCFKVDSGRIDTNYLWHYFSRESSWNEALGLSYGATPTSRNRLKEKHFLSLEIPLPSLAEQRRIVAKIEKLACKIKNAKTLRNKNNVATERLVDSAIVRIFKHDQDTLWVDGCLGDYVVDDCYGTSEKTHVERIGYPILRMGNIQNGTLDVRDLRYLQIAGKDFAKWILQPGDILVNRTNSAELVGKCAVFNLDGKWGFASYLIRLRLDRDKAHPDLVARYINSSLGREYMFRERKQMTGQANVNAKKLKALPLRLPPFRQQEKVIENLDCLQAKVDDLKAQQAKTADALDAMLPSILDRAFRGEL
jgi:type I restriction enzyme S subunit